jgi:hypothetical protein
MEMSPGMIRYTVVATLVDPQVLDEYVNWLKDGHIQKIVDEGGAIEGDVSIVQGTDVVKVASVFIFPSMTVCEEYMTGLAVRLRPEGVAKFVDTNKVASFERMISEVKHWYKPTIEYSLAEITPYLYFNGNCREALEFYETCFGGKLEIMVS